MKRRTFVEKSIIASVGTLLLPTLIAACRKDKLPKVDWDGSVGIIGGGAAGMRAAKLLHGSGVNYTLLEAHNVLGGRVKPLPNFGEKPIELGAEYVQGQRTVFYDLAESSGKPFTDTNNVDFTGVAVLDGSVKTEAQLESDSDLINLYKFVESDIYDYEGPDITIEEYANQNSSTFPQRTRHILNAESGSPGGTSMDRIGVASLAEEQNKWTAGNKSYLADNDALLTLFSEQYSEALSSANVKLNWPVKGIDFTGNKVIVTSESGEVLEFDKVIVTASLAVLKNGIIDFSPTLPSDKLTAISTLGMDAGMKIILKFNTNFWGTSIYSIIGDGPVPEYWPPYNTTNILTAFIMGSYAETMHALSDADKVSACLQDLDSMYNGMASSSFVDSHIQNWFADKYVGGSYSYAAPNSIGKRAILAKSVDEKLYFAGEATNSNGHNSTVQGAMESAFTAVDEILRSIEE